MSPASASSTSSKCPGAKRSTIPATCSAGDTVDAVIHRPSGGKSRRISLGLKQTLSDRSPTSPAGPTSALQVEGPVTRCAASARSSRSPMALKASSRRQIGADQRIVIRRTVLRAGHQSKRRCLASRPGSARSKLSAELGQLQQADAFAEHRPWLVVLRRVVDESAASASIELGEGIRATCRAAKSAPAAAESQPAGKADLSSLSSMLQARWKGSAPAPSAAPEPLHAGQIRSFKITKLDADKKSIEVQLA